ncbi:ribosomal protein L10-domain-containing protein [Lasiosphaeria miniovina]|uniref:Ribosome assembly factor mrt4 n=1 Tax=Lasiosphaeria miniovina TaxID=1954250 RepID=A0AA40AV16_9PEZI|nr:ribosomal protein L10-domain-containing protein [Lasiosphaeria miniovina]KAK0722520.1 ribosomal protein L10-domain-containing protein [Lasiosphaeria miniovina]
MPKSKRAKVYHLTQVTKKTRENKEKLFENIRACIPEYQHCFVFSVDNMRNNYLKTVRQELSDCRLFFGKTKLTARALGSTPEDAQAEGIDKLAPYLSGTVGLIFTNREPATIESYFESLTQVDFARAGTVATQTFIIAPGVLYSTGGEVPVENDVPVSHSLEPELRRLGMPTRMIRGKVVLGDEDGTGSEPYTVCREGEVLDSRQTRLLKLFSVCMSEFKVQLMAYWSASTGEVTQLTAPPLVASAASKKASAADAMDEDNDENNDDDNI